MAITKEEKQKICVEFGKGPQDTGSSQVQAVILTREITHLTGHCQKNPKDFSSKRGLLKMVCRRKKFLRYLEGKSVQQYQTIIGRLGLRK